MSEILAKAKKVFDIEIDGLQKVKEQLGTEFEELVTRCVSVLNTGGKIVLSGVGKSGHIGKKLAATLASTGSPSVFMHPVEALHGDLGILQKNDILLTLSYSGETEELLSVLPAAKRLGVPIVAITGDPESRLTQFSELTVAMTVEKEACPFNLAPTTTTTALLALGDALALVLLDVRGFTKEDYGRMHPGGAIGRSVTLLVSDIMRKTDQLALVRPGCTVKDCLFKMTEARTGSGIIISEDMELLGIFTDGDLRRHAEEDIEVLNRNVDEVMTINPASVRDTALAVEVLEIVEEKKVDDIIVLNEKNQVMGLVDIQDLPGLKLM